jgi:MYXO-CTERM domain-containing protein
MRTALRKNWLGAVLCAVTLCATAALAERDTFGVGTGRDGALTVTTAGTVINRYAQVTAGLNPGTTSIPVSTVTGFGGGDLVMVLQTTGTPPSAADQVGRWELARLQDVSGSNLVLTAPLVYAYAPDVTQVIRVPEYTNLTINAGRSITAQLWNGSTGGVVAFLATGTVTNNGQINVSGSSGAAATQVGGFRGGLYVDDENNSAGCSDPNEPAPKGAQKGEGTDPTLYGPTRTGRGNVANGGGGGVCSRSGGGGGGNAGAGGRGGNADASDLDPLGNVRVVGGLGGEALSYSLLSHLSLGGGGGAGHGMDNSGGSGGRGGGAIFIRANQLAGTGSIIASGGAGGPSGTDGAGGGGAGGSIYLRFVGNAACALSSSISANGGIGGGANSTDIGPGGGGGGGRILFQSAGGTCNPTAASNTIGANPGTQQNPSAPGGSTYGALAGGNGLVTRLTGGFIIPTVTIATPVNGSLINTRRPAITGTTQAGNTVILSLDGVEVARITNAPANYSFTPTADLADGSHQVQAIAERDGVQSLLATSTFTVDATPPPAPVVATPANGARVNTATPAISGTAEAGSTVSVFVDGTFAGTTTADASGNWTFTSPALAEGSHTVRATARDPVGNISPSSNTNTFFVDVTPPAAPVVATPANGERVNTPTPAISGTAEAGATVTVIIDGTAVGTTTADVSGNWTFTPPALSEGSHTVRATARDVAGNISPSSNTNTFFVDVTPPAAPVVVTPANGERVNTPTPAISGTAEAGSTVTVIIDGAVAGTTTADASGNWTFTSPELSEGSHTVRARATDVAGNTSPDSNTNTFTVDVTPPAAPVVVTPANGERVNTTTPTISGTAEAGSTVTVIIDGTAVGTTTADVSGNWTFTPPASLSEGSHTVRATARDPAGNISPSSNTNTFFVDLTPPAAPVVVTPANGERVNTTTPVLSGTAEPDSTVTVFVDGTSVGTTTADASGNWSLTQPTELAEGSHTVRATATDVAGNISPSSNTNTFFVDVTPPAAPVVVTPANGERVNTTTPAISGTAEAGATVTVIIDGTAVGTTTADVSGNWTFTPPASLSEGSHTVRATATDVAGNISPSSNTNTFFVDVTPPAAPVVVTPANGSQVNTATPAISGTAEPDSTVTVIIDGTEVGTTTADASGNWTFTSPALSEGSHTVRATATDVAGNISPDSNTNTFIVDLTPPAAPVVVTPANGARVNTPTPAISGTAEAGATVTVIIDGTAVGTTTADVSGNWTFTPAALSEGSHTVRATATDPAGNISPSSNTNTFIVDVAPPAAPVVVTPANGARINTTTPVLSGTAEPGSTVTVFVDGTSVGTTTADASGNWSLTQPTELAEGSHTVRATATDVAGNISPSSNTNTFFVDLTPPAAPVVVTPANGARVNTTTPVISGTAEAGATVTVIIDGTAVGTTTASASGSWTFTPPALAEGPHTVRATATDVAGNISPSSNTNTFTVDLTPPAAPVVTAPSEGAVLATATPVIRGTAEPGSTVTVIIDGTVVGTTTADASGNWTFTSPALDDGPHTVRATATDVAGNTGPASAPRNFIVDTEPPDTSIVSGPEGTVRDTSATFDFESTEAGVTYECSLDGAPFVACSDPVTFTGLAEGEHTLRVRARDTAGRVDPTPASRTWTVDTTAPAAPVITSPANGALVGGTPIFSGTAEPGSTVTLLVDGAVVGTTTANSEGNWTFTPSVPLAEGPHTVTATATDPAGNTSPPSTAITITVDTTAPDTFIVAGPEGTVAETSATFDFSASEENVTYECSLDNADFVPCTDPVTFTGLAEGEHTLRVRARDAAGNEDATPASRTWTVSLGGPPDGGPGDGGTGGEDREFRGGGCGCAADGGSSSLALFGLGALLVLGIRRRRA